MKLDDDDMDIDDIVSSGDGRGGGGGGGAAAAAGGATANDDFAEGGVRVEAIVRHHRRRCAMLAQLHHSPERRASTGTAAGLKRRGVSGTGGGDAWAKALTSGVGNTPSGEGRDYAEAMAAAAGRLADPAVVGKLFDSILPPVESLSEKVDGGEQGRQSVGSLLSSSPGSRTIAGGGTSSAVGGVGDDDPVLSLCTLYADLVNDGVKAGPASTTGAADSAAGSAGGGGGGAGSGTTPGKSVLNALAFGRPRAPIAARLWAYLQRHHDLALYAEGAQGREGAATEAAATVARRRMQSTLFLFCSAFRSVCFGSEGGGGGGVFLILHSFRVVEGWAVDRGSLRDTRAGVLSLLP